MEGWRSQVFEGHFSERHGQIEGDGGGSNIGETENIESKMIL